MESIEKREGHAFRIDDKDRSFWGPANAQAEVQINVDTVASEQTKEMKQANKGEPNLVKEKIEQDVSEEGADRATPIEIAHSLKQKSEPAPEIS